MFRQIVITFIFVVGSFSLIISIGQLFVRLRRIENHVLSALYFCLAVLTFQFGFIFNGVIFHKPEIFFLHLTLITLLGPLLFYSFLSVSRADETLTNINALLFVPSAIMLIPDVIFLIMPVDRKIEILQYLYHGTPLPEGINIKYLFFASGILTFIYLAYLLFKKLIPNWISGRNRKLTTVIIIYTIFSIIMDFFIILGYMTSLAKQFKIYSIAISFMIILAFLIGQRYPEFLQLAIAERVKKRYEHSKLAGIDTDTINKKLTELMEEEKIFTDEDFTLKKLAYELSITPHQLSQFLNEKLNLNFNTYINRYRAEEAKRMLFEEPERSVKSITEAVGFNSKSVFYKSFCQLTGKTPGKYRKELIRGKKS